MRPPGLSAGVSQRRSVQSRRRVAKMKQMYGAGEYEAKQEDEVCEAFFFAVKHVMLVSTEIACT